jgi:hypothetical protein
VQEEVEEQPSLELMVLFLLAVMEETEPQLQFQEVLQLMLEEEVVAVNRDHKVQVAQVVEVLELIQVTVRQE